MEKFAVELLEQQGYVPITPERMEEERGGSGDVLLRSRLAGAVDGLNPGIPPEVKENAVRQVAALRPQNLFESNEEFHRMLVEGVAEEYRKDGEMRGVRVVLIDFDNPRNNDFAVSNQFTVTENNKTRRPDIVLFVNGMPLAVIELKNPADSQATVEKAFDQLRGYKEAIPSLFCYNGVLVASDGLEAKQGSLTSGWQRFMAWKTVDGKREDGATTPQIETLIKGMLRPDVLLDLIRHFTVFERGGINGKEKKIAAYHQYHAVKKAVDSTVRASGAGEGKTKDPPERYGLPSVGIQEKGDRKAGVVWHTQGSGKSLSMLFYAGLLVINPKMENPTIVVITDRNDLDGQLFDAFAAGKTLLRQEPRQAESRADLKRLLRTSGGGVVFSTIQKFSPSGGGEEFELLSERKNIVVIADEAHRSQYGFKAKTFFVKNGAKTRYGFAKYIRDALPNASFIGFTGTPIEKEDASTPAVFGNYVDIYDIERAVEDKATVPIFYESRLAQVHLKEEDKEELDAEVEAVTESGDATEAEKAKAKWTRQEAIIGHGDRIKTVVADIVSHFEARRETSEGKAMIVATSRRIAVEIYNEITALRPRWHDGDKGKGGVKVVMTSQPSDRPELRRHATTKAEREEIARRFKDPADTLNIVIVIDMWLTGFDAPCLDTIYIDKIIRGHNLMQAIARVNRIYKDKSGGLVVDYIGIVSDLKRALANYTESGGRGTPAFEQKEAVARMLEKHEIVAQMFAGFDRERYFTGGTGEKMTVILEAEEHVLGLEDDGKERFTKQVALLSKAFALSVPDARAMDIKADVGFFQAVRARLLKFEPGGAAKSGADIETAIRQIVDRAVVSGGVIDVFDAAGIKKPDISILSDDFLEEVRGMKHKNLALELLRKIIGDEITDRERKNRTQSRKFSEMLTEAIRKYKNNLLTAAEVIEELIGLAREIRNADGRAREMGMSDDEVAFYDALATNESARRVMEDDTLRELARMLVENVRSNTSIDWTVKESVRAKLRTVVRRLLKRYGYPPDERKMATDRILEQAELLADEWAGV